MTDIGTKKLLFNNTALRRLIVPLIIEQVLALTVGMADVMMVASAGEQSVSAVSLVDTMSILIINLFGALATGGAIVSGQFLGAKEHANANRAARQLVSVNFIISVVLMSVCLVLNTQILSTVFGKIEPGVMSESSAYFYTTTLSFPFIAIFNAAAALFRSMGNSKTPMFNAIIMNAINISGNALFIIGFGWGAFGAGLATLIARAVAALMLLVLLRNTDADIYVRSYRFWRFDPGILKRILMIGLPNGLENCIFQLGKVILMGLITTFGTASIAANGVANSIAGVEVIPASAMGMALTTVVSQCVGAKDYAQAKLYIVKLMKMAYGCMVGFNLLMLAAIRPLVGLYNLSDETYRLAVTVLLCHSIAAMLFWPVSFALPNAFRAAGDVRFTMVVAIFSMLTFRIGFSYLFAYTTDWLVIGVWVAMFIDWIFRDTCFLWRYFSGRWQSSGQ